MKTQYYKEQLQGKINKYIARLEAGVTLSWNEHRDLRHLRRELYHIEHKDRLLLKRVNLRNIRKCLDDGII